MRGYNECYESEESIINHGRTVIVNLHVTVLIIESVVNRFHCRWSFGLLLPSFVRSE